VTDPSLEPPKPEKPSANPRGPVATSLGAIAASRRPTLPATPAARQSAGVWTGSNLRWAAIGVLLSVGSVIGFHEHERSKPHLVPHIVSGAAEIKRAPNGDQVRWRRGDTTIQIDSSVDRLGQAARDAVGKAFGTWIELGTHTPRLRFDNTKGAKLSLEPDGKNTVLVAPITLEGHKDDLAITLAFWDERTGAIAEADIVINANVAFEIMSREGDDPHQSVRDNAQAHYQCDVNAYDLQNVLTHEVGHFMGLGEDMQEDAATMYYRSRRCETQKRTLEHTDTTAATSLYATPADERQESQAAGCSVSGPAPRTDGTNAGMMLAAFAGLGLLSRRKR
jgi:MYXO-CTERM domain-containing protein